MPPPYKINLTAFETIPAVENVVTDGRSKTEVESICCYENNLYIGTNDGLIMLYRLEATRTPMGKMNHQSILKYSKQLVQKKPVQQLAIVSSQGKLLALVDGFLYLMSSNKLELHDSGQKIKNILSFCLNESKTDLSHLNEIVTVSARKKSLQIYALNEDRFGFRKDINVNDQVVAMARDASNVCVAFGSIKESSGGVSVLQSGKYAIVNIDGGGNIVEVCQFDNTRPIVKRTGKEEFLVNIGQLGIQVSSTGESLNRPPVEWRNPPVAMAYKFPYILTWAESKRSIEVYSVIDQRCVQTIPFENGKCLGHFDMNVYYAVSKAVFLLSAVSLDKQVDELVKKHLIEEALLLAETKFALDAPRDKNRALQCLNAVKQRAGFMYFAQNDFSRAESLLTEGEVDPREVIVLFDGLLPKKSTFESEANATNLHSLPSVKVLEGAGQISLREAKKFLIHFLREIRTTKLAVGRKEEIDTALVKLLAETKSSAYLIELITAHDKRVSLDECVEALEKHSCYYVLGLLYSYSHQPDKALSVWTRVCDGELTDSEFEGISYVISFLQSFPDKDLVFKYAPWALKKNEALAATIFTDRQKTEYSSNSFAPEVVLECLKEYHTALMLYLEHLVFVHKSENEEHHTELACLYLDKVLSLKTKMSDESRKARSALKTFLETSNMYRPAVVLGKIKDTNLQMECALVYGKMDEHEKALNILVRKLGDTKEAERYCTVNSRGKSRDHRQKLYQCLLAAYLQPSASYRSDIAEIEPALELLNTHGADFDMVQVLRLLPLDFPLSSVKQFFIRSLRSTIDASRTSRIEHNLAKGENLQVRYGLYNEQKGPIIINELTTCPVCDLPFSDAAFVRYPNGIVTHIKCSKNKTICPVTGKWFGANAN